MLMYSIPQSYGGSRDYINRIINSPSLEACEDECKFLKYPCDKTVYYLCVFIMEEKNLQSPNDCFEAIDLYNSLRNEIHHLLEN